MHAPPAMFDPIRDQDPVEVGGYRLRARLGGGGMGEVFLAFDASGQPVAVKVLRREFADDRTFRSRFGHEVRAARQVFGPGIAPLVGADPEAQTPWLATAYVAGPTLADAVELYGPLPVSAVIVLMSGIAAALRVIHETGIVHRDLKPANVVLGADGLRVIDFGIARAADATPLTLTGMLVGSPQYVAPEQVLGEPPMPAGDVFSLGALAHYAATGRPAFGGGPKFGVVYRIVNERPDLAGCPLQIRSLIESCLSKNPAERPTTAEILDICTPDEPARGAADWLPQPVLFAIDSYRAALDELAGQPAGAGSTESFSASVLDPDDTQVTEKVGRARYRRPSRRTVLGLASALALVGAATGAAIASSPGATGSSSAGLAGASSRTAGQAGGNQGSSAEGGARASGDRGHGGQHPDAQSSGSQGSASQDPDGADGRSGLDQNAQDPGFGPHGGPPPDGPDGPPPPPTTEVWSGTITFTGTGIWLDGLPPAPAAVGSVGGDVREAAPAPASELSSNGPRVQNLARWTGSGVPDGVQCQQEAFSHGSWQLHVSVGDIVCALTAHRQVAVLRIVAFPGDDSGVTALATVWGGGAR